MCGRYTTLTDANTIEMNDIIAEINRKFGYGAISAGEIYPTNIAPVLTLEDNRLTPMPVMWGFPKWDKKGVIINARSETALSKPLFSKPLLMRRCVIPSTGFYEWGLRHDVEPQLSMFPNESEGKPSPKAPKIKLLFNAPGESMLYMAGMINTATDASGKPRDVFCILTTAAKHTITRFHDRMPVILSSHELDDWLSNDAFMREALTREGIDLIWQVAA